MTTDLTQAFDEARQAIEATDSLVRVVLSGARRNMTPPARRIDIRPVLIKTKILLQVTQFDGRQTTAKNYEVKDLKISELLESGYSNILVFISTGRMSIRSAGGVIFRRAPERTALTKESVAWIACRASSKACAKSVVMRTNYQM